MNRSNKPKNLTPLKVFATTGDRPGVYCAKDGWLQMVFAQSPEGERARDRVNTFSLSFNGTYALLNAVA